MRRCILVCLLASVPSVGIAAWTNIGPFGGRVPSIATDSSGTNVFVLNPRSGVFRSTGGGPWTLVFDAAARGVIGSRVAVDSQNGRVYAGTSGGLFRSDDNGATWRLLINDPIFAVAAAGDRVVASAASALERSGDAGVTWKSLDSPGSDAGNTVSRVLFDLRTDRVVVVNEGAVFVSDNFGTSWTQIPPTGIVGVGFGPNSMYVAGTSGVYECDGDCNRINTDAGVDVAYFLGLVYEAQSDSVFRYTGPRWERLFNGLPLIPMLSMIATPSELLVGTSEGVFHTVDGVTFSNRSDGMTSVTINAVTATSGIVFAATKEESVMRRMNGVWTTTDSGLPSHLLSPPIVSLMANDGSTIYAGFASEGVFRSTNQGALWNDITAGLPSRDVQDIGTDTGVVLVATGGGLVKSTDRGSSWQSFKSYPAVTASSVAIKGQLIVAGKANSAIISTDGGATWQSTDLPVPVRRVAIGGGRAYAVGDQDVFVKQDSGWTHASLPASHVNAIIGAGPHVFVSLQSGIYVSDDGVTWSLMPGSDVLPRDVTSLAVDEGILYVGTNGGSIFAAPIATRRRAVTR